MSPYLNPGNRILPLKIIRELRGNGAHWSKAGWIWNRLAQPIGRMLGYSDVSGLWIRCDDANVRAAFWHVTQFLRRIDSNEEDWARMFPGQMTRILPYIYLCLDLAKPYQFYGHRAIQPLGE